MVEEGPLVSELVTCTVVQSAGTELSSGLLEESVITIDNITSSTSSFSTAVNPGS